MGYIYLFQAYVPLLYFYVFVNDQFQFKERLLGLVIGFVVSLGFVSRVCHIWAEFVLYGWDLSHVGLSHMLVEFVKYGGQCLSYLGGICSYVGGGFVIYGWGLSYMGRICHPQGFVIFFGGICQIWAGLVTKRGDKPQKVPISDKTRDKSYNIIRTRVLTNPMS